MFLTAIVAMDRKGLIGANGKIPWHLPSDLKRFRRLTMGKPVIMGRKTWESLPGPLEGRTNIVMSGDPYFHAEGATVASNPRDAYRMAVGEGYEASIIGGSSIYDFFLESCRRICLTVVDGDFEGDTYFPLHLLDGRDWKVATAEAGDDRSHFSTYYELVEKRIAGQVIWDFVDQKSYREATGR